MAELEHDGNWNNAARFLLGLCGDAVARRGSPLWVRAMEVPHDKQKVGLELTDDECGLLGWEAPPDCIAVGMVGSGTVWKQECSHAPPDRYEGMGTADLHGVRLACVLSRDGALGWAMSTPDGFAIEQPPNAGRMIDCMRRCFGLATDPPPTGASRLLTLMWLSEIVKRLDQSSRALTWRQMARLHPVLEVLKGAGYGEVPPEDLVDTLKAHSSLGSWDKVRQMNAAGECFEDVIEPELAGWMDDGMYARWLLSELPAPEELLVQVRPRVAPSAARRLAHAVRAAA